MLNPLFKKKIHGNGNTIRNGREIQSLPYAGFLLEQRSITIITRITRGVGCGE